LGRSRISVTLLSQRYFCGNRAAIPFGIPYGQIFLICDYILLQIKNALAIWIFAICPKAIARWRAVLTHCTH